ncbi:selenocysteine-specific elongation factor [Nakamurella sp. UYEF19]|uniref:selenocysteine-specific translation elongation factor n=1 Tax=Nakamurella sp. UYEF19 TaxID=1756392 RepID=UPI003394CE08
MFVIATAGHVDHGKSTLVRALTGMEPDRWAEERARGMTIDLGYAWTTLPQGPTVAFVDVPGHERFIGNMLAGVGPAPAVMMVVSADEGWRAQSTEHLAAVDALGIEYGILVVTRSDLADPRAATAQALQHIRSSSLGEVPAVPVSAVSGLGIDALREALTGLVDRLPRPAVDGRVRLWVDRAFTIRGSGTVVTGTLGAGMLSVGDVLLLHDQEVRIRSLQSLGEPQETVQAVSRVAVNLRGVTPQEIRRGDALTTPGAWATTRLIEARMMADVTTLPTEAVLHLGAGAFPVHIRPLGSQVVRLTLSTALPLQPGDRGILRNPGLGRLEGGLEILDVAPPSLDRRGAAVRRGAELAAAGELPTLVQQVQRRGAVRVDELQRLGVVLHDTTAVLRIGEWFVSPSRWATWVESLRTAVDRTHRTHPLQPGLTLKAARRAAELPDGLPIAGLAAAADLEVAGPFVRRPGAASSLGAVEPGIVAIERMLADRPFSAPDRTDLDRLGLGAAQLAAAQRIGRILRLDGDVVLLPDAPAMALRLFAKMEQPFTTQDAKATLNTSRRVAIPLLEHLDRLGWTTQLEPGVRRVVRPSPGG